MHPVVLRIAFAFGAAASAPSNAGAVDFASHVRQFPPIDNPACTCRYKGEHLPLGAERCLQTPDGPRTARCVTEQNVTSWRPGHESCPQALLVTPQR